MARIPAVLAPVPSPPVPPSLWQRCLHLCASTRLHSLNAYLGQQVEQSVQAGPPPTHLQTQHHGRSCRKKFLPGVPAAAARALSVLARLTAWHYFCHALYRQNWTTPGAGCPAPSFAKVRRQGTVAHTAAHQCLCCWTVRQQRTTKAPRHTSTAAMLAHARPSAVA
jgi:hypothetical protein